MISQKINVNVRPSAGYLFEESGGVTIRGNSWIEVVKRVQSYRSRNKMAPGSPEREVIDQACQRDPQLRRDATTPTIRGKPRPARPMVKAPVTLKSRVLGWLRSMRKLGEENTLVFVNSDERKRRAKICTDCPKRQAMKQGCGACKKALDGLRDEILGRGHATLPPEESCVVLGTDLPVMTWLDELTVENGDLPATCWRKKTL